MMKKVLRVWRYMIRDQWDSPAWNVWTIVCILLIVIPMMSYPFQLLITSAAKAILSPIPQLAAWTIRHDMIDYDGSYVYNDDMYYFVACADMVRIFFVSCVISAVIEFFIAFLLIYSMKKKVLRVLLYMIMNQWGNPAWNVWTIVCILLIAMSPISYPFQVLIASAAKAILSPIPQLAAWVVRYDMNDYDDMTYLLCADTARIFFVSCVIFAVIEFFIAFLQTYSKKEKSKKIEA